MTVRLSFKEREQKYKKIQDERKGKKSSARGTHKSISLVIEFQMREGWTNFIMSRIAMNVIGTGIVIIFIIFIDIFNFNESTFKIDDENTEWYYESQEYSINLKRVLSYQSHSISDYQSLKLAFEKEKIERNKEEREKIIQEIVQEKRKLELELERIVQLKKKEEENQKPKQVSISRGGNYQSTYEATFYTSKCNGCTGTTASGDDVSNTIYYQGYRVVAAPPHIAFYTKLKITLKDGTAFNAIVLDRGGSIKNKRLDILVASKEEAYNLGRQQVKVEMIN